ncbi:MAG: undecaprenyl-diphosphate phosphatase [Candidatus Nealsonbacteria bacterium]|nr:undecaprenyl-diphosphate phosphatase [Candidatus Nealsonbacteria bacterium]
MIWLEILVLAIVQGIAEFLPVSSSGHIVVGQALFDELGQTMDDKLTVSIVLHVGTLLAILVFYWRRIWGLLGQDRRLIGLLIVGSIPAAVVGLGIKLSPYNDAIEEAVFKSPLLAGLMFPVTGLLLLWTARNQGGETICRDLGYGRALLIGVFQAFAILPGISRSGTTIVAGLTLGLRRDEAATFSFLLAIPAIGGAGLLETVKLVKDGADSTPLAALALGAAVSFAVGLVSLFWLVRCVEQGRLYRFAWWVIPLGVVVIAWQLFPRMF